MNRYFTINMLVLLIGLANNSLCTTPPQNPKQTSEKKWTTTHLALAVGTATLVAALATGVLPPEQVYNTLTTVLSPQDLAKCFTLSWLTNMVTTKIKDDLYANDLRKKQKEEEEKVTATKKNIARMGPKILDAYTTCLETQKDTEKCKELKNALLILFST